MRWRWLGGIPLGAALILAVIPGTAASAAPIPSDTAVSAPAPSVPSGPLPSIAALEAEMLARINAERAAAGVGAVQPVDWAHSVAEQHSQEMAAAQNIWHNIAGFIDQGRKAMGATALGENVAMDSTLAAADALLFGDPPHRSVTLDARYNYVGIGGAYDSRNWVYLTEDFAQLPGQAPAAPAAVVAPAKPAPKPVATTKPAAPKPVAAATPAQPAPAPTAVAATPIAVAPAPASAARASQPIAATPVSHTTPLTGLPVGTGIAGILGILLAGRRLLSLLKARSQPQTWRPSGLHRAR